MRHLVVALGLLTLSAFEILADEGQRSAQYQNENFLESLRKEITKQDQLVNAIKNQVERTDIVPDGSIVAQFDNAYTMLNVKKTLYANFADTPSMESPLIQAKLLQIFKKDLITPGDLAELSELVKQERPKYTRESASSQTQVPQYQPAPAPQPSAATTSGSVR